MCTLVYVQRPEQGTGYSAPSLLFQLISLRRAISLNLATDSESSGPSWPQSGNPGPAAVRRDTTQFISDEVLDLTKTISADRGKKGSFSQTLVGGGRGTLLGSRSGRTLEHIAKHEKCSYHVLQVSGSIPSIWKKKNSYKMHIIYCLEIMSKQKQKTNKC